MDDGSPGASILLFVCLLAADILFYGFSSAILGLNVKDIEKRAHEEGDAKSRKLERLISNPAGYVNTMQLVCTLINLTMGGYFLRIWHAQVEGWIVSVWPKAPSPEVFSLLLAGAALLYILLTFGVVIPRRAASRYAGQWAYFLVNPMYALTMFLRPVIWLIVATAKGVLRLFGIHGSGDSSDLTEEEIISMVNEGHEQGVIQASEAEMITNIFEFGDKEAKDIMTNRKNIVAVDADMPLSEAVAFMLNANNSRFPVYEESLDHIIGILHLKDAMRIRAKENGEDLPVRDIQGLMREAKFIPETKNVESLFRMMQSAKTQMVIVVDEYGQTMGLIAMEDILEEIVGNLMDEYDEDEDYIEETGNADEYIIEGKTRLEDLEERFGICFDEEEFETLNGFMISKMDKIPEEDEQFDIDVQGYNFKILSVSSKMIQSVLVTKLKEWDKPRKKDGAEG